MAAYIPLIYHVIVVLIGLLLGLYAGITIRGLLKLCLVQPPKKKQRTERKRKKEKSQVSFQKTSQDKSARKRRAKSKKQKTKKDAEKPYKPSKKRDLKSCLYDKNDSWTDFNCTLDGEDNNDVIKENRRGQDDAYNIIKRKRRSKK